MSNFTDKDKGWNELMTSFRLKAGETAALVGYTQSSGKYKGKDSMTVAQVAAIQEYGSKDGKIPERSFIRSAMKEHEKEFKKLQKKVSAKVIAGKLSKSQALGILAQAAIDWIKNKIDSNVPPANAPSTVAAKGSSHTLIDTGQMRNSLGWEIKGSGK